MVWSQYSLVWLLRLPKNNNFNVEVVLADGSVFPQTGRLGFTEPSYSSETGTYLVRAVIANPKGALRPGQFVRVHLRGAIRPNAILVPQRAVMQGAKGHFVWVLTAESKAEFRTVEAGDWHGDNWFINRGLKAGERVAVDGAMKLAAGVPVKVVEAGASTPGKAAEAKPAGGQ
jgi:membrane fusion protein (multidrug efflux system)